MCFSLLDFSLWSLSESVWVYFEDGVGWGVRVFCILFPYLHLYYYCIHDSNF
ncbi:hypothetical protein B0H12DRAFT_1102716 [Mycena haematopus]|nr:hypothetical protein B0H12DRAFT_1102716 [Mycena haematopus]